MTLAYFFIIWHKKPKKQRVKCKFVINFLSQTINSSSVCQSENPGVTIRILDDFRCTHPLGTVLKILFKPNHGTAPDIAGKNIINPTATIQGVKLMLDWLAKKYKDDDCKQAGELIEQALMSVYTEGKVLTGDLGGDATTTKFTDEVLSKI